MYLTQVNKHVSMLHCKTCKQIHAYLRLFVDECIYIYTYVSVCVADDAWPFRKLNAKAELSKLP